MEADLNSLFLMYYMYTVMSYSIHFHFTGCVTNDMLELLDKYEKGVRYKSRKDSTSSGKMQIPFAQVGNMCFTSYR